MLTGPVGAHVDPAPGGAGAAAVGAHVDPSHAPAPEDAGAVGADLDPHPAAGHGGTAAVGAHLDPAPATAGNVAAAPTAQLQESCVSVQVAAGGGSSTVGGNLLTNTPHTRYSGCAYGNQVIRISLTVSLINLLVTVLLLGVVVAGLIGSKN